MIKAYKGDINEVFNESSFDSSRIHSDLKKSLQMRFRRRTFKWLSVVGLLSFFGVIIMVFYFFYMSYITEIPEQKIPAVVGLTQEEAELVLDKFELQSLVVGSRLHLNMKQELLLKQNSAGRLVKSNRVVRLFVSQGLGPVLVPNLIGFSKMKPLIFYLKLGLMLK